MGHVKVYQLCSMNDEAYMNVEENYGNVSVEGYIHDHPVLLAQNGRYYIVLCFDNEAYMNEWIENNKNFWAKIIRIEGIEDERWGE